MRRKILFQNPVLTSFLVLICCGLAFAVSAQPEEPLTRADQMPFFAGCDDFNDEIDKKRQCSNESLVSFIANNITYPERAQTSGVEGTVYVSFVIDHEGAVTDPAVIRDIGNGCGKAALDVLKKMPAWEPGIHEGEKVRVKLNLPIRFSFKADDSNIAENYSLHWGSAKGQKIKKTDIQKNIGHDPVVRNAMGNLVNLSELKISVKKNGKIKEAASNGFMNKDMKKLLTKTKAGNQILLKATLQEDGEFLYVIKEFEVIE